MTNQELLDRYIHAMWLPGDLGAEVRSNLESLIEDRAAQLGRDLRLEEVSGILKQYGHPMTVASRYRDPNARGLISPHLFPLYWFALRAIFAVWVAIRVMVAVFVLQGPATLGPVLLLLGRDIFLAVFFIGGGITALFALWEHLERKYRYSERWEPESLAAVPRTCERPMRPRPVVQVIGQAVLLAFLALALFAPGMAWVWGGRGVFSPSDTVYAMRLPLWLLALLGIAQSWSAAPKWRRAMGLALCAAVLVLAVFLLSQGDLLVMGPKWNPTQARPLATLNQMLAGILALAGIFAALVCIKELRRWARRTGRQTADSVF